MSTEIADFQGPVSRKFDLIKDSLLQRDDLPLADVIDCEHWQTVFDQHGIDFGADDDCVYTPAITLWALISQAFFKAEMRSCKAAVARVAALWAAICGRVCSTNTGLLPCACQDLMGSGSRHLLSRGRCRRINV